MSLGRSSRFASLALLRKNLRKCYLPLHLHPPSPFIMVVWCVARILGTDVGKTLMNMEMLKFLKARSVTRLYPWYQLECAFHLPSCSITIVSFPNWVCHSFEFFQTIICKLPYAGMESFNDLWIKSNSFCHLREYFYEPPSLRSPVMEWWQTTPRYLETMHRLIQRGIVLINSNLHSLFHFFPLDVCSVSWLERCSTSHSVSWSWVARSLRRSIPIEFLLSSSCWMKIPKAKTTRSIWSNESTSSMRVLDREDYVSFCVPSSSYPMLESRDEILV